MNLVLLEPDDLAGDEAVLRGRRARHVREVHRVRPGDVLQVGLVGSLVGDGTVLAVEGDEVRLRVHLCRAPPARSGIDLLLALPRPKVLKRLLAATASLGVERVVLVNAARVEKSYFDSPFLAPDALREALVLGLEQARDTVLPEVRLRPRFRPFVEDELPSWWPAPAPKLVAHPASESGLEGCEVGRARSKVVVAVGPEGGFVPFELDLLARAGFTAFTLGERILRVDTAVVAVVAQLQLLRRLRA